MAISIITGFDGSCPHFQEGVKQEAENKFTVYPGYRKLEGQSEESKTLGGSRFYIRLENSGAADAEVAVIADWEIENRVFGHDHGYVRFDNENWHPIPGIRLDGTRIQYNLHLTPGITELALSPEYNYSDCANFVKLLRKNGLSVETIGQSRENRDMWMLTLPSPNPNALNFFLQARDHAYETSGSYCVEGIVDFLLSESSIAHYIRSKFNFFIVPMTNPDGVYNGMSRLTWEQGADMNRILCPTNDPAHAALKQAIDKAKPKVHMNIHNWINKFVDGLLAMDEEMAEKIQYHFPDDVANHKRWRVETHSSYLKANNLKEAPAENKSWKNYCKESFDAYGVNFEFPWFSILPKQMKQKGVKALTAFALAVIEEMNL
jgi:hypothetical protein